MAVTLSTLKAMRERGDKIAVLTCYDASFARVLDAAGVDVLLVGDSLGMVIQGHASTLPVKLAKWRITRAAWRPAPSAPSSSPTCPSAATSLRLSAPTRLQHA